MAQPPGSGNNSSSTRKNGGSGGHVPPPASSGASNSSNSASEAQFFKSVAQKVAENLLYHVDGRLNHRGQKRESTTTVDRIPTPSGSRRSLDLTKYNFPPNFKITPSSSSSSLGTKRKSDFMRECELKNNSTRSLSSSSATARRKSSEEWHDSNGSSSTTKDRLICSVCGQRLQTMAAFNEHTSNNHPNVYCGYYRLEPSVYVPREVLCWQYNSPQGMLSQSSVIPMLNQQLTTDDGKVSSSAGSSSAKCTKCGGVFQTVDLLHQHIIDCARKSRTSTASRAPVPQIKSEMKSQRIAKIEDGPKAETPTLPISRFRERKPRFDLTLVEPMAPRRLQRTRATVVETKSLQNLTRAKTQLQTKRKKKAKKPPTPAKKDRNNNQPTARVDLSAKARQKKFPCKHCERSFAYEDSLKKHRLSCAQFKNFMSSKTKKVRTKKEVVAEAAKTVQTRREVTTPKKVAEKPVAAGSTKAEKSTEESPTAVDTPKDASTPGQENICPICDRSFRYSANFRKHTQTCSAQNQEISTDQVSEDPKTTDEPKEAVAAVVGSPGDTANTIITTPALTTTIVAAVEMKLELVIDAITLPTKLPGDLPKPDLWKIKQEHPQYAFKGSPAQHHSCPFCQRGFTYLANYRKHIKSICPIMQQMEDKKRKQESQDEMDKALAADLVSNGNGVSVNGSDNNNNRNDHTNKLIANGQNGNGVSGENNKGTFRTFSCNICHKIYLSQFQMLRHRLSHKLTESGSSTRNLGSSSLKLELVDANETQNEEEIAAKLALSRQSSCSRRKDKTATETEQEAVEEENETSLPIGNLLEHLARGGQGDNGAVVEELAENGDDGEEFDIVDATENDSYAIEDGETTTIEEHEVVDEMELE